MTINLDDYIAGGYYISHYMSRPVWMVETLIPDSYLSLSGCISDRLPVASVWQDGIPTEAKNLGMTEELWELFKEWSNANLHQQFGYPDTFYKKQVAQSVLDQYFPIPNQLRVMGIALHKSRVQNFLETHKESGDYYGVYKVLSELQPLTEGAIVHGLEVLGYENGISHSWLCYSMESHCNHDLGICPNDAGLLEEQEADVANVYVSDKEAGWNWQPWLIVEYPSS